MSYDRHAVEKKWQDHWQRSKLYHFDPSTKKPIFSIDTPPPYAHGSLHMGRATAYTLIDFVARYKRMRGFEVFFPLCFDVNGTPIEVRVEKKLGITKKDIDRQKFIETCSRFADENIAQMTDEFNMLGESMDPSLYYRTDSPEYRRMTQISFLRLFHRDLIYKGEAPVNWCPRCMTALADAEVEYRTRKTKLNFIQFGLEGGNEKVTIATTRPELLCTCQLVAVHPRDGGKAHLVGARLRTPLFDRLVNVVADDKVDPDFGTGIVMICTIGDKDDLDWVHKYDLPIEKGINEEGRMTSLCRGYEGLTVDEARQRAIGDMKGAGLLVRQEELEQSIGVCWRCHNPIEFLLKEQWFLRIMDSKDDMLRMSEELVWHPEYMKIRLQDWINSLRWDWVISRQRYFATPIPIWECTKCERVVPAKEEQCYVDPTVDSPPVEVCPSCGGSLKGCEDVFDTWMDSSITPLVNAHWLRDEARFKLIFPMSLRPQAHDIIRTWTFYTMLRSKLLTDSRPWNEIMIHGYIMAPDGKPMHTSLGNIIDPLPILKEHGSDAFRYYATTCTLGKDSSFMEKEIVHGSKLCTKLWNLERFVKGAVESCPERPNELGIADRWILSRYSLAVEDATRFMEMYEFSFAMKAVEGFLWHEFADHYVEMVKHRMDDAGARYALHTIGYGLARMLAPFLPHVTEEVYQNCFRKSEVVASVHGTPWPVPVLRDEEALSKGEALKEVVAALRSWKASKGMKLSAELQSVEVVGNVERLLGTEADIAGTAKVKELRFVEEEEIITEVTGVKPNYRLIGTEHREDAKEIIEALQGMPKQELTALAGEVEKGEVVLRLGDGRTVKLSPEMVEFQVSHRHRDPSVEVLRTKDFTVLIRK